MPTINKKSYTADWIDSLRAGFMYNLRPRQKGKLWHWAAKKWVSSTKIWVSSTELRKKDDVEENKKEEEENMMIAMMMTMSDID